MTIGHSEFKLWLSVRVGVRVELIMCVGVEVEVVSEFKCMCRSES